MNRVCRLSLFCLTLGFTACAVQDHRSPRPVSTGYQRAIPTIVVPEVQRPQGETADWWYLAGAAQAAERGAMAGNARNIILFVGDGMSLTTVAAARIFAGQRQGTSGEEHQLAFERLPYTALSRTYNTDAQTPDSAGTMTAMITGVKTRIGVLSVDPAAARSDCAGAQGKELVTLFEIAEAAGLSTGIVTTTRLTHATPAAGYAHSPNRNWEDDQTLAPAAAAAGCADIARQFVEPRIGDGPEVALAGGRRRFLPESQVDPEYPPWTGLRRDGRNLVDEWVARRSGKYVWNRDGLVAARGTTVPLLGLFQPDHLRYEHDRPSDVGGEPSLAEMTVAAIERLSGDREGFLLLVEAGRIDHAHHEGNAFRALVDTSALSDAVAAAVAATDAEQTLIVVTADHSHTLTFAGYPARGNPILGKVQGFANESESTDSLARDALGLPYTTLGYANGPGYGGASDTQSEGPKRHLHDFSAIRRLSGLRPDLTTVDTTAPDYLQDVAVPLLSETHGGDDVGVWAGGPGAAAFRGSIEQNVIFHLMLQSHPLLRARVCRADRCNADGVPVTRPLLSDFSP